MKVLPDVTEIPKKPLFSGVYVIPKKEDIDSFECKNYISNLRVL